MLIEPFAERRNAGKLQGRKGCRYVRADLVSELILQIEGVALLVCQLIGPFLEDIG